MTPDTDKALSEIQKALGTIRVPAVGSEYDLHEMIGRALSDAGVSYVHEAKLGPRRRIDFLIGDVGVEVKRGKVSRKTLMCQIEKYVMSGQISSVIVVTTRGMNLPGRVLGARVVSFGLNRLWGVALP